MFGRRKNKDDSEPTPPQAEKTPVSADPLQAARLMSDRVFDGLVKPLKLQRGVPTPVIVATLGALAGHACQVATLRGIATNSADYRDMSIVTVQGANGDRYLMGDAINRPVLEWQYSVWALVAGITESLGVPLPDLHELARHVASTAGGDTFGIPRDLPSGSTTPRSSLALWSLGEALANDIPHPDYVPVCFALAYQRLVQTENAVNPAADVAALARIMMESTLAMSKLEVTRADLGQNPVPTAPR